MARLDKALIYTPTVQFFAVADGNQVLHDAIYTGLTRAFADGSHTELLFSHPQTRAVLANLDIKDAAIIGIDDMMLDEPSRLALEKYAINFSELLSDRERHKVQLAE